MVILCKNPWTEVSLTKKGLDFTLRPLDRYFDVLLAVQVYRKFAFVQAGRHIWWLWKG